MNEQLVVTFLHGAAAMGYAGAGLFFLRFYRSGKRRLFAFFGASFLILAVNYAVIALGSPTDESRPYYFSIRLIAFLSLIIGIIDANRASQKPSAGEKS